MLLMRVTLLFYHDRFRAILFLKGVDMDIKEKNQYSHSEGSMTLDISYVEILDDLSEL